MALSSTRISCVVICSALRRGRRRRGGWRHGAGGGRLRRGRRRRRIPSRTAADSGRLAGLGGLESRLGFVGGDASLVLTGGCHRDVSIRLRALERVARIAVV